MADLKCPHCGKVFTVDESELDSIVKQIRDKEFKHDVEVRLKEATEGLKEKHKAELKEKEADVKLQVQKEHEKVLTELREELQKAETEKERLKAEIDAAQDKQRLAVQDAVKKLEEKNNKLESDKKDLEFKIKQNDNLREIEVRKAVEELKDEKHAVELKLQSEKEKHDALIDEKDKVIEYYKDLKTKMSTKMVGETLEQHCEIQFNQLRATAFKNVYFEKDNDSKTGSKGDYIYRENDELGNEIVSIMFEMKNEMDTTATKHKNEDFFKELDKDRREKNCEYAVLVSLLESDNELYNAGIVDVSYKYDKMYVVRPQCFIPIITVLRNAAMNALSYKQELAVIRNQNIDITNFEDNLLKFKDEFGRNYSLAHDHFDKAIDEIDKTIQHLEKVKKELLGSDNQLRLANNKVDEVSVKKLTRDNPTMEAKFEEVRKSKKKKE